MALLYENDYIFRVRKMDKHWFSESDVIRFADQTRLLIEEILIFNNETVLEEKKEIVLSCLEKILSAGPQYFFANTVYTWLIWIEIHSETVKLCSFFHWRQFYIEDMDTPEIVEEKWYVKIISKIGDMYTIRL